MKTWGMLFLYFTVQLGGGTLYPMIGHFVGPNAAKECETARQGMIADLTQLAVPNSGAWSISPQCRGAAFGLPVLPPNGCDTTSANPNCPG